MQRQRLLRPFPRFTGISSEYYGGTSSYNAGTPRIEKRFSRGYTILGSYTWAKQLEELPRLNLTDTDYERRLEDSDMPHRISLSGIWDLPFGRGNTFGRAWKGAWGSADDRQRPLRRGPPPSRTISSRWTLAAPGSTSPTPRSRPTAWLTRSSSATIRASTCPGTSAPCRRAPPVSAIRRSTPWTSRCGGSQRLQPSAVQPAGFEPAQHHLRPGGRVAHPSRTHLSSAGV